MYVLPNKKQINTKKLEKAFRDSSPDKKFYLDAITGGIVLGGKIKKIGGNIMDEVRFFEVPKLPEGKKLGWMNEFVDEMLWGDSPDLALKLKIALDKRSTQSFMNILSSDESGWIHGWSQWESDYLWEEIIDWFCGLPIDIQDDMSELDDDCPLCRLMKEGNNSLEDLKKAFKEAKENGAFVGEE